MPDSVSPQTSLHLNSGPEKPIEVLDLFAGIGGLSLGFKAAGFTVIGVDNERISASAFCTNNIGQHIQTDLHSSMAVRDVPVVIGGPPCRPWSAVNLQRRGRRHDDHALLKQFFLHLLEIRPSAFLMENVPPLLGDPDYKQLVQEMQLNGYVVSARVLRYSDFGAATSRRRLFTVGFCDSFMANADHFFQLLEQEHQPCSTVHDAISWLRYIPRNGVHDHEWSNPQTIARYKDRYQTGQYGWRKLTWNEPAPSFGSVAKTYILHPDAGQEDLPRNVLSVREVLSIMGFDRNFHFPSGTALHTRYGMSANAVSPIVAEACARVFKRLLCGGG